MQVQEFRVERYRSVYDLHVRLGPVNVVTGANGCGKSNLFNAFVLLRETLLGSLGGRLVREGGLKSILWAGPRTDRRAFLRLSLKADPFEYSMELGLRPESEFPLFPLDPQFKSETLKVAGRTMVERRSSTARLRDMEGRFHDFTFLDTFSLFAQSVDPEAFPYVELLRGSVRKWALFHDLRTDAGAPIRQPSPSTYPLRVEEDGSNLASCLYLISAREGFDAMTELLQEALPESTLLVDSGGLRMRHAGLLRNTELAELSDGTLKLIHLAAACFFPHPPPLVFFNEPETSLSPAAIPVLARLIEHAAMNSQIWVTTHSMELAGLLRDSTAAKVIHLEKLDGETYIAGGSRRGRFVAEED